MFKFLKPKAELGGFARALLADVYAHIVTLEDPAGELDAENVLSPRERETANRAFRDFKFAAVYSFLFIKCAEGKITADPAAFTKYTFLALWMALKDNGMPEARAQKETERIAEDFMEKFGDLLDKHEKAGTRDGLDFMICRAFATKTLNLDLSNETDREKHFLLFSMSKNLLKLTYGYAEEQFAQVRVVCTS